ncbi:hypothetical protein BKN38_04220 [Helicobacter sp. CLO-3]|nr:hypothetical protein BA723_00875 [Helicobacter sp. CLO-3]OHU84010.1 hypothetical protein BKN38_04220 [Helicobacter sp. CLO-3]
MGYRKFALAQAKELGVLGSVQNLQDGSVEVYAKASKEVMGPFIAMLKEGPSRASVEDLQISVCEADSKNADSGDLDSLAQDSSAKDSRARNNAESKAQAPKTQAPKAPAHIDFTDFIILP